MIAGIILLCNNKDVLEFNTLYRLIRPHIWNILTIWWLCAPECGLHLVTRSNINYNRHSLFESFPTKVSGWSKHSNSDHSLNLNIVHYTVMSHSTNQIIECSCSLTVKARCLISGFSVEWLTLLFYIPEVPGSNLGPKTSYPDGGF
jgi:hypothetical protein